LQISNFSLPPSS